MTDKNEKVLCLYLLDWFHPQTLRKIKKGDKILWDFQTCLFTLEYERIHWHFLPKLSCLITLPEMHWVHNTNHLMSRHWFCYHLHIAQVHLLLSIFKPTFTGTKTAPLLAIPPLTDNPFCALSSSHTHTFISIFFKDGVTTSEQQNFNTCSSIGLTSFFICETNHQFVGHWCLTASILIPLSNLSSWDITFLLLLSLGPSSALNHQPFQTELDQEGNTTTDTSQHVAA